MQTESVRQRKVADKIKQLVSVVIDRKLKDPGVGMTTVTHVRCTKDLGLAYIYFTVFGDEETTRKTLKGLERARNFIRNEIARDLQLRTVPELRFFVDDTQDYARKIGRMLDDIKPDDDEQP